MKIQNIQYKIGYLIRIIIPISAIFTELIHNQYNLNLNNIILIHKEHPSLFFVEISGLAIIHFISSLKVKNTRMKNSNDKLSKVLKKSICSFIIIDLDGTIEYINYATKAVYGSEKTINKNIFNFATVKGTKLEECIRLAMSGKQVDLKMYKHISATKNDIRYLDITFIPFEKITENKYKVLLVSENKTNEKEYEEKLGKSFIKTINAFAKAMDARDKYTSNHSHNVKMISQLILSNMKLPEEEIQDIIIAAGIHDIGKIGITDIILKKEGCLNEEEFRLMKKHTTIGASLLSEFDNFKYISDIILHHHERIDGQGYPYGLKGEDIPIGAQVVCIADALDAMFSKRVYSEPLDIEQVRKELINNSGKQFNAEIVNIIINNDKLFKEIAYLTQENTYNMKDSIITK